MAKMDALISLQLKLYISQLAKIQQTQSLHKIYVIQIILTLYVLYAILQKEHSVRTLLVLPLFLSIFFAHAEEEITQEDGFQQLFLTTENVVIGEETMCAESLWKSDHVSIPSPTKSNKSIDFSGISPGLLSMDASNAEHLVKGAKKAYFETYAAGVVVLGGYLWHVADYYDGTRVVTALDGGMRGYQGVSVYGIQTAESVNVEWHKDYFVHRYPTGKIYSYPNRQIIEIK